MGLVSSFIVMLQPLACTMTAPSFANWCVIVAGWVFAPRRTVTCMLGAAGAVGTKHHGTFHRLFAGAQWSLDELGLAVFRLLEPWLEQSPIFLALDDTLAHKRSRKIYGVSMHIDPAVSTRRKPVAMLGHSWVVLGVVVRLPLWPQRAFCLPLLFRLYQSRDKAERNRRVYRTRPELGLQLLRILCTARKHRRFHVLADSAYGGQSVLNYLPENCDLTSRLLMQARLYDAPPVKAPGTRGRQRKRGDKLPTPREMLARRSRRVALDVYGRRDKIRYSETVARWHSAPDRALRVIAVEPLSGGRKPQAFYSTRAESSGLDVLREYATRWSIEVAFHDSKGSLGFEEPQGWTRRAVERTAPTAMLLYSLIVLWFVQEGHRHYRALNQPWYTTKKQPSFADMLATLRRVSTQERFIAAGLSGPGSRKITQALETILALAA
jgi:hypothetical protein